MIVPYAKIVLILHFVDFINFVLSSIFGATDGKMSDILL